MSDSAAGWQSDPSGKHDHRYWDGTGWTDNVADGGVAGTDPYEAPAAEPGSPPAAPEVPAAEEPTVVTPVAAADTGPTDTTAPYPTAPPAGVPPPYVPPTPTAAGDRSGGGGGGASKRGLLIGGAILAAVALAVVAFLALSGDDDDPTTPVAGSEGTTTTEATTTTEDTTSSDSTDGAEGPLGNDGLSGDELEDEVEDIIAEAEEALGLRREQAECLAEKMTEAIEDGSLAEDQALTEIFDYLADCDISLEELGGN